ncbi:MAG TPA: helix-turn-helix domain-containing protein [Bacillota bacterium]|nr:helix-turn-helix domain-containing protein [Bacillota bacterium]
MYKVVIVVDDASAGQKLKMLFPWELHRYEVSFEAFDIFGAMRSISMIQPELILIALEKSEQEGLGLVTWIREKFPQGLVGVVCARKNFSYIREMLQLGAVDYYITAKADYDSAGVFLARVTRLIRNNLKERLREKELRRRADQYRELAVAAFWRDVFTCATDDADNRQRATQLGIPIDKTRFVLMIAHQVSAQPESENVNVDIKQMFANIKRCGSLQDNFWWLVDYRNGHWVFVGSAVRDSEAVLHQFREYGQLLAEIGDGTITVSISPQCGTFHQIPQLFRETMEINLIRLFHGGGRLIDSAELTALRGAASVRTAELISNWESLIRLGNHEAIDPFIEQVFSDNVLTKLSPEQGRRLILDMVSALRNLALERRIPTTESRIPDATEAVRIMDQAVSCQEWLNWIRLLTKQFWEAAKKQESPQISSVINKTIKFIEANYARDLTLKEVADCVGVSDSYLSRAFTKFIGENFNHYLRRFRVERAKELLHRSELKIHEIARKVGFWNVRYFSRVFYELAGVTPANYRLSLGAVKQEHTGRASSAKVAQN